MKYIKLFEDFNSTPINEEWGIFNEIKIKDFAEIKKGDILTNSAGESFQVIDTGTYRNDYDRLKEYDQDSSYEDYANNFEPNYDENIVAAYLSTDSVIYTYGLNGIYAIAE